MTPKDQRGETVAAISACRVLDDAERTLIAALARSEDEPGKHAAFIYGILREPLFDTVMMSHQLAATPLTEAAMTHIAEHWRCSCVPSP